MDNLENGRIQQLQAQKQEGNVRLERQLSRVIIMQEPKSSPSRGFSLAAFTVGVALACGSATTNVAAASTHHDFDSPGTPYSIVHGDYGSNPTVPTVIPGGPTGSFLRLATMPAVNLNTIAFDRTDAAATQVTADFDFRMTPPPAGRASAADGFGFALLKAAAYGNSGPVFSDVPETALFSGSLSIGFRIYNANAITVAFNGSQLASVNVSPVVDLASGQFIHAQIIMRPGGGISDVTVILTPSGKAPTMVIDHYPVPGFAPYAGRVWFGARSGGLSANHDLDNINVQFTGTVPPPDLPFVQLLKAPGMEFVSYSPTNFNPNRVAPGGPLTQTPSPDSITRDLEALRPGFKGLILYGTQTDAIGPGRQLVPWIVSEARRLGFRAIVLGVWDPKDNNEVDAAAALVSQFGTDPNSFAVAVCIGNEGILRGEYGIAELDTASSRLQSQLGGIQVPIVTSEDLARYTIIPALQAWGTFVFPIIVPHWNVPSLGPVEAAAWVRQAGATLANQAQMTVLIKEAGYPSGQLPQYTPETQRQFFAAYMNAPRTIDSTQFPGVFTAFTTVLEAFDAPWKSSPDFKTWGLLQGDRTPKLAYTVFTGSAFPVSGDLDGDAKGDLIVWRPDDGTWYWLTSSSGYSYGAAGFRPWGAGSLGDKPLIGDIDGDGKSDLIVWRPGNGTWYWLTSSSGYNYTTAGTKPWGAGSLGDVPLVGDIDGDGKADLIVWRPGNGTWYWLTSSSGYNYATAGTKPWGAGSLGDIPLVADVDGDGKADLIVWRPGTGTFYWLTSSSGYNYASAGTKQWGAGSQNDVPLLGDIDGDGKSDLIVWRPGSGTWYWLTSSSGYNYTTAGTKQWGAGDLRDKPLVADIDGDGKADLIVWRPGDGTWYWLTSLSGYSYGRAGTKP